MKFHHVESQGGSGCRRISRKDNRNPEVSSSPPCRGGGRPLTLTAADYGFGFLCLLIFAGTPLLMVLS